MGSVSGILLKGTSPTVIPIYHRPVSRHTVADVNINDEPVLKVAGVAELTAMNCDPFQKQVCAAWNGHTVVEIDLSETTFMDCAGLSALVTIRNLTHGRNGAVRLINPTSPARQFLDLVRAGQIFEIIHTG